jgi:hypothetical protein
MYFFEPGRAMSPSIYPFEGFQISLLQSAVLTISRSGDQRRVMTIVCPPEFSLRLARCYDASVGISFSANRKNRVLRVPATKNYTVKSI